jgi:predicted dehydrogenase
MHFADCIRNDREPLTNADDARADVEIAVAIVRAVLT